MRPILVNIDSSRVAAEAIDLAHTFAHTKRQSIVLIAAIDSVQIATSAEIFAAHSNLCRLAAEQRRQARKALARYENRLRILGAQVRTAIIVASRTEALLRAARKLDAELIVFPIMASAPNLDADLKRLLRLAPCPVVVFRVKPAKELVPAQTEPPIRNIPNEERATRPMLRLSTHTLPTPPPLKRK